jgi:hypothetical protein
MEKHQEIKTFNRITSLKDLDSILKNEVFIVEVSGNYYNKNFYVFRDKKNAIAFAKKNPSCTDWFDEETAYASRIWSSRFAFSLYSRRNEESEWDRSDFSLSYKLEFDEKNSKRIQYEPEKQDKRYLKKYFAKMYKDACREAYEND